MQYTNKRSIMKTGSLDQRQKMNTMWSAKNVKMKTYNFTLDINGEAT